MGANESKSSTVGEKRPLNNNNEPSNKRMKMAKDIKKDPKTDNETNNINDKTIKGDIADTKNPNNNCKLAKKQKPILTFDTNADHLLKLIMSKLVWKSVAWCTAKNECMRSASDVSTIYYNTPLRYGQNIPEKTDSKYIHFVYLDFNVHNQPLIDLMHSLTRATKNVVIMTNLLPNDTTLKDLNVPSVNLENIMYRIVTNNCSDKIISESIAIIINGALLNGKTMHPNNLISLSCKDLKINKIDVHWDMIFDIHSLIRSRHFLRGADTDCIECPI